MSNLDNSNSFCFEDTTEEPSRGKSSSQPEDLKKEKSNIRHSKTVTIERRVAESYIHNFVIDNKFVILGKIDNWVLIWEHHSDVFYQKSENNKWQHLNLNAVKLSELGVGKSVVKKEKFAENEYMEFKLIATRKPAGRLSKAMKIQDSQLRLRKLTESRSVSVIDGFLEIENDVTLEILSSLESVIVQVELVLYA